LYSSDRLFDYFALMRCLTNGIISPIGKSKCNILKLKNEPIKCKKKGYYNGVKIKDKLM